MEKQERNKFLEKDGLFWDSGTHEWFHDKSLTSYAQRSNSHGTKLPEIVAFVVRDKKTGEYNRVLMDKKTNEIVYNGEGKSLEQIGVHIDKLKAAKRYETATEESSALNGI